MFLGGIEMSGPFRGIKIVDLTSMLSGPWATTILGDQGADVIKVELPGSGDHVRSLGNRRANMSSMFLNINRNKRSITIDLKASKGRDLVLDLARDADVFILKHALYRFAARGMSSLSPSSRRKLVSLLSLMAERI
jgi:crotonobetainyl-CoA:carnitine CoA-transferase CaiB-like acyl-CoA transferase